MFEVHSTSPIDDVWEERNEELATRAGKGSCKSSVTAKSNGDKWQEHMWLVKTFKGALALRKRLEELDYVCVTIREQ